MRSPFTFVPRKKLAGAYFNDGSSIYHVQQHAGKPSDPILVEAIRSAAREFSRVFNQRLHPTSGAASADVMPAGRESNGAGESAEGGEK